MSDLRFTEHDHRYCDGDRELVSVTQMIFLQGHSPDYSHLDPKYRQRGSAVHRAIHLINQGFDINAHNTHPEILKFAEKYRAFGRDTGFIAKVSEIAMADLVNGLAGRMDVAGEARGEIWEVDFKTGTLHPSVGLQLCAYESLMWDGEFYPDVDKAAIDWIKDVGLRNTSKKRADVKRKSLNLTSSGDYKLRSHDEAWEMADWKALVRGYRRRVKDGMVKGK